MARDGTSVVIDVVSMESATGIASINFWHTYVQKRSINKKLALSDRADRNWNWPFLQRILPSIIRKIELNPIAFVVLALDNSGQRFVPIGLAIGIEPFDCIRERGRVITKHGFAWFLMGIPASICAEFDLPELSPTQMVVNLCRYFSLLDGDRGRIVLHADPSGGDRLVEFYMQKCGLEILPKSSNIRVLFPRRNDGRYFRGATFAASSRG